VHYAYAGQRQGVWRGTERIRLENRRVALYFADPYASWQRGHQMRTPMSGRQLLPKGADFKHDDR